MHTYVCVSGGKKCSLFGKFVVFCFLETPVLRFAILPYHQRTIGYCRYRITLSLLHFCPFPANIYLLKVNNRNIRKKCEIYSKLKYVQNTSILNSLYLHCDFYFFDNFYICQTLKFTIWDALIRILPLPLKKNSPLIEAWGTFSWTLTMRRFLNSYSNFKTYALLR